VTSPCNIVSCRARRPRDAGAPDISGQSATQAIRFIFDHNAPVRTNTAVSIIGAELGVWPTGNRAALAIYPNPVRGVLHLDGAPAEPAGTGGGELPLRRRSDDDDRHIVAAGGNVSAGG